MNNMHITRNENVESNDYYPTPQHATFALIEKERVHIDKHLARIGAGCIWEPAAGRGWMSMEFMRLGYGVVSSDILVPRNPMIPITYHDFINDQPITKSDVIISNPPYARDMAQKFTEKAISLSPYVAMLCRATWVESQTRYKFFSKNPPSRILFFSRRFSCTESYFGTGKENGGMVPYAWFVWDRFRPGASRVDWIDPDAYDRWKEDTIAKSR